VQYETRFGSRKANNIALDGKELWLIISDFASQPIVLNQKYATPNERATGALSRSGRKWRGRIFFGAREPVAAVPRFGFVSFANKADKTPSPGLSLSP
jgi:hypothetical protein